MSQSDGPSQDNQRTIGKSVSISGIGIHSGESCRVTLKPAGADNGIFFIFQGKKFPARADLVTDTSRGTSVSKIQVVEHLMAAVSGLGIDNLEIELSSRELPMLDGSALPYLQALKSAGILDLGKPKNSLSVSSEIKITDGQSSIRIVPFNGFRVNFMIDFPYIGRQEFSYSGGFEAEIAPARTFGLIEELEQLKSRGLAKGASLENALAIDKNGYLNAPRFKDEPVRHKVLDLIGDFALIGRPVRGEVFAIKSGHKLNIELSRRLLALC
ncbi:MAG: UDP-3-O-acyl-N-acetylglucosamine deacetylase [Candidatus Margulisiibacteriota bacterium]